MNTRMVVLCLVLIETVGVFASWDYDIHSQEGPRNWTAVHPNCGGSKQSPIDIQTGTVKYNPLLKPISLGNYKHVMPDLDFNIKNNGHTAVVSMKRKGDAANNPVTVVHDGKAWRLLQLHFHWGSNETVGSEHAIDGVHFPSEVHLVHYNTKYAEPLGPGLSQSDGLLVIGVLMKVGNVTKNMKFDKVIKYLQHIRTEYTNSSMTAFALSDLLPNGEVSNYYTYPGSLTTPNCYEAVTWIVASDYVTISPAQMNEFRLLRTTHGLEAKHGNGSSYLYDNFRHPQALNGRIVEKSFTSSGIARCNSISYFVLLLLTLTVRMLY